MHSDFWLERWRENQIGFHQQEINAHLRSFWSSLGISRGNPVFVPLCGKSADMLWLRSQDHTVLGIELSPLAVEAFFVENHLDADITRLRRFQCWESDGLKILCGDFFDLKAADLEGVSAVYDRASLIALPPPMRQSYALQMKKILAGGTRLLLVSMEYDQAQMQGPPFAVSEEEVRQLYSSAQQIETIFSRDILDDEAGFRKRGLTRLIEKVYLIQL